MSKPRYSISTGAAVALTAGTARTTLAVIGTASFGVDFVGYEISFDGVTATTPPVLVELCQSTFATNSTPGTANTAATVIQTAGRIITPGFTGFYASTSEPTVLTAYDSYTVTPNGGTVIRDYQAPNTPDSAVSNGFVIRLTANTAGCNARATMFFERC